jgi:hypothetical protein
MPDRRESSVSGKAYSRSMSLRDEVSALIKSRPGADLCDGCIRKIIGWGNRSMINEATRYLSGGGIVRGFARSEGICSICDSIRVVIRSTS